MSMKKPFLVTALAMLIGSSSLYGQSASSSMAIGNLNRIDNALDALAEQTTILASSIRTSQQKDLVIGVSLECGLTTVTQVRSKGGTKDTSSAEASVLVRVVVDRGMPFERVAYPGWVSFCKRSQTLSATLQGIIENLACFVDDDMDPETPKVFDPSAPGCELTEEEIELGLETLNANAFNFGLDNVGTGIHTIHVEAEIGSETESQNGDATAAAIIGKGSATVSEVRWVKAETGAVMN